MSRLFNPSEFIPCLSLSNICSLCSRAAAAAPKSEFSSVNRGVSKGTWLNCCSANDLITCGVFFEEHIPSAGALRKKKTCSSLLHKNTWQTLCSCVGKTELVFSHSLTPAWQHERTKTSLFAAVDSSCFQTSHAIWDEGSASLAGDHVSCELWLRVWGGGVCGGYWSHCGHLLPLSGGLSVVREGKWGHSGFMCVRVMKQADKYSDANRFTRSSPPFNMSTWPASFCLSLLQFTSFFSFPVYLLVLETAAHAHEDWTVAVKQAGGVSVDHLIIIADKKGLVRAKYHWWCQ